MAIKSIKVAWKVIGQTAPFQKRVPHYYFAPKITYDNGKTKSIQFDFGIDKKDYKGLYLWDSYYVVETNRSCYIFDENGEEKAKISCETMGTILWLQNDGVVSAKGSELLKFDIDGKLIKQSPATDFINEENIAWIKEDMPDVFEKILNLKLWSEVAEDKKN